MKLRGYQQDCFRSIFQAFSNGNNKVMVQSPTGTGKSVIIAELVKAFSSNPDFNVLFVVDTRELLTQIAQTLYHNGIIAGIIMAGVEPTVNRIQVASIQTLNRRNRPKADFIIIDEAHGATADSYKMLWELYPDAKIVGFTATPYRLSGIGFSNLFDVLIETGDISHFIAEGYLVPIKQYSCSLPNYAVVTEKNGEYEDKSAIEAMKTAPIVDTYLQYCNGEKGIVFAQNVEHSKSIVEQYKQAGISAVHLDSNTNDAIRAKTVKMFREGKIKILSNVNLFIKGFDVPDISFVQLLRMTKSLTYYLQSVGRATRPLAGCASFETKEQRLEAIRNSDKPHCKILDHAGVFLEHGLATQKRDWQYYFSRTAKVKTINRQPVFLTKNESGDTNIVSNIQETVGLELLEVTQDLLLQIEFNKILERCLYQNHKLISSYFAFMEYLKEKKFELSEELFEYISDKLLSLNNLSASSVRFNPYFLKAKKKELFNHSEVRIPI